MNHSSSYSHFHERICGCRSSVATWDHSYIVEHFFWRLFISKQQANPYISTAETGDKSAGTKTNRVAGKAGRAPDRPANLTLIVIHTGGVWTARSKDSWFLQERRRQTMGTSVKRLALMFGGQADPNRSCASVRPNSGSLESEAKDDVDARDYPEETPTSSGGRRVPEELAAVHGR